MTLSKKDRPRPWWDWLTAVYFTGMIGVGLAAIPYPSGTFERVLGYVTFTYAGLMIGVGVFTLFAWWNRNRSTEFVGMCLMSVVTLGYSCVLLWNAGDGGYTTAGRLANGSLGLIAWAGTRYAFGVSRSDLDAALRQGCRGDSE